MTETLWLAGLLIANLWAAGNLNANNTEKDGLMGAGAGAATGALLTRGGDDRRDAQEAQTKAAANTALNQMALADIVQMSQTGVSDAVIIRQMDATGSVFALISVDIQYLHDQRVSDQVISAMLARRSRAVVVSPEKPYYGPPPGAVVVAGQVPKSKDERAEPPINQCERPYCGEPLRVSGPPILSQIPYVNRLFCDVGYEAPRTPVLPPIKHGERPTCEEPPTQQEIVKALPTLASGVPFVYEQYREEIEFTAEKVADRVDEARIFPLIGMAQLHHCYWKCTVNYTDVIVIANPIPFTTKTKHTEIVFIDRDHLHLCGEQKDESAAQPPQSCPAGQFRPMVKELVKEEPAKQVLLEVMVASIDRSAIPDATYRWAKKHLGLSGANVGFSIPKSVSAASELVEALQQDGFVNVLAMPRVTALSGKQAQVAINGSSGTFNDGFAIDLLPVLTADGKIQLEVRPSFAPGVTATRDARVAALLGDGQTMVIGGLTYTQTTESDNGVPILNDLPIVGALFGGKQQLKTERDLLILVRARILAPGDAAETSEPPLSSPKLAPFPTRADNCLKIHVIVDDGSNGQQVSVVPFEGQSVLDVIAGIDALRADNVKDICVTRRTSDHVDAGIGLPIDWKQLIQSGRCGVELKAGDRINIALKPADCETRSEQDRNDDCQKAIAQAQANTNASRTATSIDDVVKMSKAGVAQKIILRQLELTNASFNLSADDIIALHQQGVSKRIISAMQERRAEVPVPSRTELLMAPPPLTKYSTTGYPDQAFDKPVAPSKVLTDMTWTAPSTGPSSQPEESEANDASPAVTEVTAFWYDQVEAVGGNVRKPFYGLAGRVYLGNIRETQTRLVEANGCLHVEMYDPASGEKLSEWRFAAEDLKQLKRLDFVGTGYTLFLGWEGYRPEIKQVEVRMVYMPENGDQPRHAAAQVVRLRPPATERPILQQVDFESPKP